MDPQILGALLGGGFALAGVVLTLLLQGRREDRHRFTAHRQEAYAEYYLLSNKAGSLRIHLTRMESIVNPKGELQTSSSTALPNKTTEPSQVARELIDEWPKIIADHQRILDRMLELTAAFAIMCPYPLRKAARAVFDNCISLSYSLGDPDKMKRTMSGLADSQVKFVNLARKDLGITPWWKFTKNPDSWLGQIQSHDLINRDAIEKRGRGLA